MKKYMLLNIVIKLAIGSVLIVALVIANKMIDELPTEVIKFGVPAVIILTLLLIVRFCLYIRAYSSEFTDKYVMVSSGIITKKVAYYPVDRIQNVELSQNAIELVSSLCEIKVTNAGVTASIKYIDINVGKEHQSEFNKEHNLSKQKDELN